MARGHLTSFIYTSVSIPGLLFEEEAWQHHDQHQQQQEWQQQQQPCNDRTGVLACMLVRQTDMPQNIEI
jgi:hypothetical protein